LQGEYSFSEIECQDYKGDFCFMALPVGLYTPKMKGVVSGATERHSVGALRLLSAAVSILRAEVEKRELFLFNGLIFLHFWLFAQILVR